MNWLKISGISGMIAPLVAFTFILLAIAYSPNFGWTENALSDLGVQEGVTAVLFNSGLIIGGILILVFALGLLLFVHEKILGRTGAILFILDALALSAIGVFPENVKPAHFYASVAFFVIAPISMFFFGLAFIRMSKVKLGLFTLLAAVAAVLVWTIPFGEGIAIPEALSALSASAWSIVLGFKMLKEAARSTD